MTEDKDAVERVIAQGYEIERRALSYASDIPAVNALLADCGAYARAAAETLRRLTPSAPPQDVKARARELPAAEYEALGEQGASSARRMRAGRPSIRSEEEAALRAIETALTSPAPAVPEGLRELSEKAADFLPTDLTAYEHGAGRLAIIRDGRRKPIADFYGDGPERDFFMGAALFVRALLAGQAPVASGAEGGEMDDDWQDHCGDPRCADCPPDSGWRQL
ncbi:MAG TPA: hypothetical protein VD768_08815 [Sphingomicrobium sp.]|nr:hypothetical protein [Sphingomicrobium sp.]